MPSSRILSHRPALCNMVRRVAEEAGELVLRYYDGVGDLSADMKADGSPVTIADREAEKLIAERLAAIAPDVPFIGEEAVSDGHRVEFDPQGYFWLVDPLDGTREFMRGGVDFTVNIGLIYRGEPVLGVIYAPERGELYAGFTNEDGSRRAFRFFEDSETEKDIRVRKPPMDGMVVLASSQHKADSAMIQFLDEYKIAKIIKRASSIKLCAVASGRADMYVRFGLTCEWDTAAGDAILRAAGGMVKMLDGQGMVYGLSAENGFLNPHFVAAPQDVF